MWAHSKALSTQSAKGFRPTRCISLYPYNSPTNEAIKQRQYSCQTSSLLLSLSPLLQWFNKLNNPLRTNWSPRWTHKLVTTAQTPDDIHALQWRNVRSGAHVPAAGPKSASRAVSLKHDNFKKPFVSFSPLFQYCTRLLFPLHLCVIKHEHGKPFVQCLYSITRGFLKYNSN
jgi:hypothetical protein